MRQYVLDLTKTPQACAPLMNNTPTSSWFYADAQQQQQGPVSEAFLREQLSDGRLSVDTLVWTQGMADWQPASSVLALTGAPAATPPQESPAAEAALLGEQGLPASSESRAEANGLPESGEDVQQHSAALPTEQGQVQVEGVEPPAAGYDTQVLPAAQTQQAPAPVYAGQPAAAVSPPIEPLPKKRMSGCLIAAIVAGVLLLLMVPIIGIFAAIAVPAYQDYLVRAALSRAQVATQTQRVNAVAFLEESGRCPSSSEIDAPAVDELMLNGLASIEAGVDDASRCIIRATIHQPDIGRINGASMWWTYDADTKTWSCSANVPKKYLPSSCQ